MILTEEQKQEMQRLFPNGWEESDIPAFWRKEQEELIEEGIKTDAQAEALDQCRCPECNEGIVEKDGLVCPKCEEKYNELYQEKNRVK